MLEAERRQVATAARRLAEEKLVLGTSGNVSLRGEHGVAVTPTGAVLGELEAAAVAVVDLDGEQVDGDLPPTSELELHLGVMRRYGTAAVVHTHSPMATAVACVLQELPLIHYGMLALGGAVRVAPYATFGTEELAEATLSALEDRSGALMANHGAIVHAGDLDQAVELARLLEWASALYWHASALGHPRALSREEQQDVVAEVVRRGYGARRSRSA